MRQAADHTSTYHFASPGRHNLRRTVTLACRRAVRLGVKSLLVFIADGEGALLAAQRLVNEPIRVVAVTFPFGQQFLTGEAKSGSRRLVRARTSDRNFLGSLRERGIVVVQGTMPFQPIIIPGVGDSRVDAIQSTLRLFSNGMVLCVQAVLMATDAGVVEPGEDVVAMAADTAIVASGALSHWMFHPTDGLHIKEIICWPRRPREQAGPLGKPKQGAPAESERREGEG